MNALIKACIVENTDKVLNIYHNLQFESMPSFYDDCVEANNRALQILYDVRQIPWDKEYLREKNYTNWTGISATDVAQLQSVCDLLFHYLLKQEDYIPKTLTPEQQREHMMPDVEWTRLQRQTFLKGVHHHFSVYPNANYTPPTAHSSRLAPQAKIDTLLAALSGTLFYQ
jgi:hypothetical protein